MGAILFFICLAFPLLEIMVLVKVGQIVGLWTTLALLIGMGVLGVALLQHQGWSSLLRAREAMRTGEAPIRPMLDGLLLTLAGVLFVAPGFISDALGLLLLIPPVRRLAGDWLLSHSTVVYSAQGRSGVGETERTPEGGGPIIEGEFRRLDEKPVGQRD